MIIFIIKKFNKSRSHFLYIYVLIMKFNYDIYITYYTNDCIMVSINDSESVV